MSTTGRVGNITGLQFDCLSLSYAGENKQIKVWAGLWGFWKKIVEKALDQRKEPCLRIEPTNADAKGVPILHIITEDRHAELLDIERKYQELTAPDDRQSPPAGGRFGSPRPFSKDQQLRRRPRS